jgi:HlyD family secretion protein/adhesin transport system membrane fusion protein
MLVVSAIALFVLVFLIWASVAEVDEAVRAQGRAVPSGQTRVVQHLEGGIIAAIHMREGQRVRSGDRIYTIESAWFSADQRELELDLMAQRAIAQRLRALLNESQTLVFSADLQAAIPDLLASERAIFEAEWQHIREQIGIYEDQVNQQAFRLEEVNSREKNLQTELSLARENLAIIQKLAESGSVSRREYLTEMQKVQSVITRLEEAQKSIPVIEQELSEARRRAESTRGEIRARHLRELNEANLKILQMEERLKAFADRDRRRDILAPVNGIIKTLHYHTVGGIVRAGEPVAEVTPLDEQLMIEARVRSADRARVWVGQKARVEITAYEYARFGMLTGEVVDVSPDSFTDEAGGEPYYQVRILSDQKDFGPNQPVMPGMMANVYIQTGSKRVIEYILNPLKRISQDALREP